MRSSRLLKQTKVQLKIRPNVSALSPPGIALAVLHGDHDGLGVEGVRPRGLQVGMAPDVLLVDGCVGGERRNGDAPHAQLVVDGNLTLEAPGLRMIGPGAQVPCQEHGQHQRKDAPTHAVPSDSEPLSWGTDERGQGSEAGRGGPTLPLSLYSERGNPRTLHFA